MDSSCVRALREEPRAVAQQSLRVLNEAARKLTMRRSFGGTCLQWLVRANPPSAGVGEGGGRPRARREHAVDFRYSKRMFAPVYARASGKPCFN